MSDLFEKLMEQIEMPLEARRSEAFSSADIIEVKVHSLSRRWDFHFSFEQILPIELYRELEMRLVSTFKNADIKASFDIKVANPEF
ncbi:MAG: PolC-type DNA polymerase III N-terminal domain-containing protein, partial [Streptococcus hyovaginalis]|nr:PolC-type DNA polymerase III N-terminal domain-containing protein [Streptococcus hyovaginalis]